MKNLTKTICILTVIFFMIAIAGCSKSPATGNAAADIVKNSGVREIDIKAFQFGYNPDTITVNKGEKIKLIIDNTDVPHGIRIPELGLSGKDEIEFTADKAGEFTWYCLIPCGQGHTQMIGKLIIK